MTSDVFNSCKSSILHLLAPQDTPAPFAGALVTQLSNILTYPLVALSTTLGLSALVTHHFTVFKRCLLFYKQASLVRNWPVSEDMKAITDKCI